MWFLLESICVGLIQGGVFDIFEGLGRCGTRRRRVWLDIVFGPLSALLLFFCGLVILNGQIHPLLLIGSAIGMLVEHITIGVYLSATVAGICRFCLKSFAVLRHFVVQAGEGYNKIARNLCEVVKNVIKKEKKTRK